MRIAGHLFCCIAVAIGLIARPARAEDEIGERPAISTVLFGSMEAGGSKSFASFGVKRAVGSALDSSGFRVMTSVGLSREPEGRLRPRRNLDKAEGQTLLGYEWRLGDTFVALYGGTDFEIEQRSCGCATATVIRYGKRVQADLWSTPTDETMFQASASVSSLDRRIWTRLAAGYATPWRAYAGPEIEFYRQAGYDKLRLGAHVTGLRFLGLTWRVSGGWQRASDRPGEAYATLGLHWRNGPRDTSDE